MNNLEVKQDFWSDEPDAWPSPAKLNLFLHITGRRPDGYHLLQTLFTFLDYGDSLFFDPVTGSDVSLDWPDKNVAQADNLIYKAAMALKTYTDCDQGIHIRIKKRLPMGGGIGGGSSNAATTLVALNHLWGTNLSNVELAKIGLQLGADVPIFIHGHTAWAEGVGEHLTDLEIDESLYLVAFPQNSVSTEKVFSHSDLPRQTRARNIDEYKSAPEEFGNDCEKLVYQLYPEIQKQAEIFGQIGHACLTGTGSSLFLALEDLPQIIEAQDKLDGACNFIVTRARNLSPLFARIRALRC